MKQLGVVLVTISLNLAFCFSQSTDLFCGSGQCNTKESQNIRIKVLQDIFATEIRILRDALENEQTERQEEVTSLRNAIHSTYVRWGRTSCPDTAALVYDGKRNPAFDEPNFRKNQIFFGKNGCKLIF